MRVIARTLPGLWDFRYFQMRSPGHAWFGIPMSWKTTFVLELEKPLSRLQKGDGYGTQKENSPEEDYEAR